MCQRPFLIALKTSADTTKEFSFETKRSYPVSHTDAVRIASKIFLLDSSYMEKAISHCTSPNPAFAQQSVKWVWQSNPNPWSKTEMAEWSRYSDIENKIIEEAYTMQKPHVFLDNYHIDFKHRLQISNDEKSNQRPIQRRGTESDAQPSMKERYTSDPIAPASSFHTFVGSKRIFIESARKLLGLNPSDFWICRKHIVMEKTMLGVLVEGKLAGKYCEAKWIVEILGKVKDGTWEQIGSTCVYLYSLDSFLYKLLNHTMRLIGDRDQENIWQSKLETLGPFAVILASYVSPYEGRSGLVNTTVYRGAWLSDENIDDYRRATESKDPRRSFQAFTSCSRSRDIAERFGNVLFVLNVDAKQCLAHTLDVASLSDYPDEQEVLIGPGRSVRVERVEHDPAENKHVIYLTLLGRYED